MHYSRQVYKQMNFGQVLFHFLQACTNQFLKAPGTFGDLESRVEALRQASFYKKKWQILFDYFLQACTNQFQKVPGTFGDLGSRVDALEQASLPSLLSLAVDKIC